MRNISWVWVPSFVLLAASPASAGALILSDIRTITGSVHEFVMSDTGGEARFDDTFNFTASASEFTAAYAHRSSFDAPDSTLPLSILELTHSSIVSRDHIAARGDGVSHAHMYEPDDFPQGVDTGSGTSSTRASITMNVGFQLATPHRFDLKADLTSFDLFNDAVQFSLCGEQDCLMNLFPTLSQQRVSQSLNGVLDPGVYTLAFGGILYGNPNDFISDGGHLYDVDLQLTPVPEPGTMALFTVGLGILASRRRNLKGRVKPRHIQPL